MKITPAHILEFLQEGMIENDLVSINEEDIHHIGTIDPEDGDDDDLLALYAMLKLIAERVNDLFCVDDADDDADDDDDESEDEDEYEGEEDDE